MNRLEIVTLIAQRLGSRTDLAAEILANMQWVQENELEGCKEFLPWFLLDPAYEVTLASGTSSVALSAMLQPDDGAIFRIYPTADPTAVGELVQKQRDRGVAHLLVDTARPTQIALFDDTLYVDRKADQEYKIYFAAFVREAALTVDSSTNAWTTKASDWFVAEVMRKLALRLQNDSMYKMASTEASEAKQRVWVRSEAFEHAGKEYQMGMATRS